MSIPLNTTGGLFNRWGKMAIIINSLNKWLGDASITAGMVAFGQGVTSLYGQYNATDSSLLDGLFSQRNSYRGSHTSLTSYLVSLASSTLITMANDDVAMANPTVFNAMLSLITQMGAATASVQQPTTSLGSVTAGSANIGNAAWAFTSTQNNGVKGDYIFNETVTLICNGDAQTGATARQEQFSITTPIAATPETTWNYPQGSGVSLTVTLVDAQLNNSGGNLLTNSDFELFTTNVPNNWITAVGTPGTDIGDAGSGYTLSHALRFTQNSGSLPSLTQQFGNVSGTNGTLLPSTTYAVNFWARKAGTTLTGGAVTVDLVDGTNTVINDAAATANSKTILYSTLTTGWANYTAFFRTPAILPAAQKIRVRISTAITTGSTGGFIDVDDLAVALATQLYAGGPYFAGFAGGTQGYVADSFTILVNNAYDSKFQQFAEQAFGMRALGLQLPSAASPTIPDSLIA